MAESPLDSATVEPFEITERPEDVHADPLQLEATLHPATTGAADGADLPHARWAVDLADEHVNPRWDEWFEVVSGELRVVFDGTDVTLTEDDEIVIPADIPHRHWNPADRPARIRYEARPGLRGEEVFETIYTLAQAGQVRENGLPNPLQFAVIQDTYPGYFYSAGLPRGVQRAMFAVLAPIGRRLGYEASYSRDAIDDLR